MKTVKIGSIYHLIASDHRGHYHELKFNSPKKENMMIKKMNRRLTIANSDWLRVKTINGQLKVVSVATESLKEKLQTLHNYKRQYKKALFKWS